MARVYVALGSNLDRPIDQVRSALRELAELSGVRVLRASRLYRTAPVGPPGQDDYINAVAALETAPDFTPLALLDALQTIERAHGRTREHEVRWGPRPLDLDLLLYDDRRQHCERLTLPHPHLHERRFVLQPLTDIAPPDLQIPGHGTLAALLAACPPLAVTPIDSAVNR